VSRSKFAVINEFPRHQRIAIGGALKPISPIKDSARLSMITGWPRELPDVGAIRRSPNRCRRGTRTDHGIGWLGLILSDNPALTERTKVSRYIRIVKRFLLKTGPGFGADAHGGLPLRRAVLPLRVRWERVSGLGAAR